MGQRVMDKNQNVFIVTNVRFYQLTDRIAIYLNDTDINKKEFHLTYGSLKAFYDDFTIIDTA